MGEMNLGTAFDGTPRILRDQLAADLFTASGQVRTYSGTISDTNKPFRVTLAWTDAPGNTTGSAYNNNLDLTVTVNGNVYKGNVFNGQYSTPGGMADTRNNLESVFLPAGVTGGFVITVTGASINSVGVPNTNNALEQDFALDAYNANTNASPVITGAGFTLASSTCNGAVNPGDTVTLNFSLQNIGVVNTTNVVATLLSGGGITVVGSSVATYGPIAAGAAAVSQPFTVAINGPCGGALTATLQLQDNGVNIGTANYTLQLGQFNPAITFTENFDELTNTLPPTNWYTLANGGDVPWIATNRFASSGPNSEYVIDAATNGESDLFSAIIPIASATAQLSFRQYYNVEDSPENPLQGYDGGVLEISIDGGVSYIDILLAGGSFVSGGYNSTISHDYNSILADRYAWSGDSGGYITTTVNLPASAQGRNVGFRWRFATDDSNSEEVDGWYVDSVVVYDGVYTCCGTSTDIGVSQTAAPLPAIIGSNLTYTITVTNKGPGDAQNVTLMDTLPPNAGLFFYPTNISTIAGRVITCNLGLITNGGSTNIMITVVAGGGGLMTNLVSISSTTLDYNSSNDTSTNATVVNVPPYFFSQPYNVAAPFGTNVTLSSSAGGTAPIGYQWLLDGTPIAGATSTNLVLTNIQYFQAGGYSILATNLAGSATNLVAVVQVLSPTKIVDSPLYPPPISDYRQIGTNFTLSVTSVTGVSYTLQYKNSLSDTNWISILPPSSGTGATLLLQDPSAMPSRRFYRVLSQRSN
jgi:uncharacterized repeat protein (TIGR01451 family)